MSTTNCCFLDVDDVTDPQVTPIQSGCLTPIELISSAIQTGGGGLLPPGDDERHQAEKEQ